MTDDAAEKIDAICQAWAADSGEPFGVCVVRHGVIVLNAGYGTVDGKPMTARTTRRIHSITKVLAGSAMMMLVDKRVGMDDPVDKYIPVLRDAGFNRPITIRDCFTHTSGLEELPQVVDNGAAGSDGLSQVPANQS